MFRLRFAAPSGAVLIAVPESRGRGILDRALRSLGTRYATREVEVRAFDSDDELASGVAQSRARFVLFVDPRLEALHPEHLEILIEELAVPNAVAVSPKIVSDGGEVLWNGHRSRDRGAYAGASQSVLELYPGCFLALREQLVGVRLPFDDDARASVVRELGTRWRAEGGVLRFTPHTAFSPHLSNGAAFGEPARRDARSGGRFPRKAQPE
jgi:hypothetical protein